MLIIKLIQLPLYRIFVDIFPDFQIILFVPNHMVVKRPLPEFSVQSVLQLVCLLGRYGFKRADHIRYSRGGAFVKSNMVYASAKTWYTTYSLLIIL